MTNKTYTVKQAPYIWTDVDLVVDFLRKAQKADTREQRRDRLPHDGVEAMKALTEEFMQSNTTKENKMAAEAILFLLGDKSKYSHKDMLENGDISAYKYGEAYKNAIRAIGTMAAQRVTEGESVPVFVCE
ncbi:MAG: hypothetical protein ACRBCK_10715 [Alphaproteobacteria bacterium]